MLNKFKNRIQRVDLHIVMLLSIVTLLFLLVFSTIISNKLNIFKVNMDMGYIFSIPIFLFPQGIIFSREVKMKSWIPRIQDREYFWMNELLVLYFIATLWGHIFIGSWFSWLMFGGLFLLLYWVHR